MDVLSGPEISSQVIALIEASRKILILVTPYFDPWARLSTAIKTAVTGHGVKVRLLLRGGVDRAKQEENAKELIAFGVQVSFLERLHAKVYLNETTAIVTSMNLLKSSALDSWEMAMRADSQADEPVYTAISTHTRELFKRAKADGKIAAHVHAHVQATSAFETVVASLIDKATTRPAKTPARAAPPTAAGKARKSPPTGHCIRCGDDIALDPEHPYCATCYKSWARFKNPEYEEPHCHACGKARKSTMTKPLCRPCWEVTA